MNSTKMQIFRSEKLQIDYFKNLQFNDVNIVVFTFTERGNTVLDGYGFGGSFLLGLQCDIVAIKSASIRWFEEITSDVLALIESALETSDRKYSLRFSYGSSMGAYAVMRFAKYLKVDRALAISPLYNICWDDDKRYQVDIANISDKTMMNSNHICDKCIYNVVYDPFSLDKKHIEKFSEIIDHERLRLFKTPFSGHPSGYFLSEVGILKDVVYRSLFKGEKLSLRMYKIDRKKSPYYSFWLGVALNKTKKFKLAAKMFELALEIRPTHYEALTQLTTSYIRTRRFDLALKAAREAVRLDPKNSHRRVSLLDALEVSGKFAEGLEVAESILRDTPHPRESERVRYYQARRDNFAKKLNK